MSPSSVQNGGMPFHVGVPLLCHRLQSGVVYPSPDKYCITHIGCRSANPGCRAAPKVAMLRLEGGPRVGAPEISFSGQETLSGPTRSEMSYHGNLIASCAQSCLRHIRWHRPGDPPLAGISVARRSGLRQSLPPSSVGLGDRSWGKFIARVLPCEQVRFLFPTDHRLGAGP